MSSLQAQTPRGAPAVSTQRQDTFDRIWQRAIAENPSQAEEEVLAAYIRIAYTTVMEQYGATSGVFFKPYLIEKQIHEAVKKDPKLRPLILKRSAMVGPAHFRTGQDGFAFINPRAREIFSATNTHQINPVVPWNDSRFNMLNHFWENAFLIFVEIADPAGADYFKYIGTFYVRTYDAEVTLDRYANSLYQINEDHLRVSQKAVKEGPQHVSKAPLFIFQIAEDLHGTNNPFREFL